MSMSNMFTNTALIGHHREKERKGNALSIPPMQLSSMTKMPYALVDYIMLLPWLALVNVYVGTPLPETVVLGVVMVNGGDCCS